MFDVRTFYDDYNIPYTTEGKNTQKGWINTKCPFCEDTSNHLGFNIKDNYFFCWKCRWHSIWDVISNLTPVENPNYIIKKYDIKYKILPDNNKKIKINKNKTIKIPGSKLNKIHKDYLMNRGYNPNYIIKKYKITGTNHLGDYCFRIIAPIFYHNKIVSYQGRDITNIAKLRYKACKKENEIMYHKNILYNIDNCNNNYIIVTEGIFDVWALGDNSCCTFGKNYSKNQLLMMSKYENVFVFFDNDNAGQNAAEKLCNELSGLNINTYNIVEKTDAADMNQDEIDELLVNIIKKIKKN